MHPHPHPLPHDSGLAGRIQWQFLGIPESFVCPPGVTIYLLFRFAFRNWNPSRCRCRYRSLVAVSKEGMIAIYSCHRIRPTRTTTRLIYIHSARTLFSFRHSRLVTNGPFQIATSKFLIIKSLALRIKVN